MDPVSKRVNRIVGQVKGIERMIHDGRDTIEILQQLSAIKKAINGLTHGVLVEAIKAKTKTPAEIDKLIKQAIDL